MVSYERVSEAVFRCETKRASVQSGRLMGGGPLRKVVAMRELTVVSNSTLLNVKNITRLIGPIRWSV